MVEMLIGLVALSALGTALITYRKQRSLRDSWRDSQRRLYLAQARLTELENTLRQEQQKLQALMRQQSGGPLLAPSTKIADAIALNPHIREVLRQFHLGGCSSCAINEEHTIEQAAMSYGVDLEPLMAALTALPNEQELLPKMPGRSNLLQLQEF